MAETGRASLKRIAQQLGVSPATVSRVLNGLGRKYRISPKTEAAIRKLAQELNFSPNQLARGLRLKKTLTIGLLVPEIANPYFASIASNVVIETRKRHYSVLLCDSQEDTDAEIAEIESLRNRNVDGLVLCPVGRSAEHLRQFEKGALPVVLVDRYFPDLDLPFVASDNFAGAREATFHLLECGHRRIACLQGTHGTRPNDERVGGYRKALEEHRIAWDEGLLAGSSFDEQNGYVETKLLLRRRPDVTAIFACNNLIALGSLRALREEGRKVPDDISMICYDNPSYLDQLSPPLSAMAQRELEIGQIAVKLLFGWIESPEQRPKGGVLLSTRYVPRESVKRLRG